MSNFSDRVKVSFGAGLLVSLWLTTTAVWAAGLPGGATTLSETHGSWTVSCGADKSATATVHCSITQALFDKTSNRRILGISIDPATGDSKGVLLLPFGLALQKGVTLQFDAGSLTAPQPFRTCVPTGCVVMLSWNADVVKAARSASALRVGAEGDSGKAAAFSIALDGFGEGFDRALQLSTAQ